ncbi:MAG: hypothetical protein R3E56_10555 [Burkholderiaceae bacterium]
MDNDYSNQRRESFDDASGRRANHGTDLARTSAWPPEVVTALLLNSACAPVSAKADGAEATPEAVPMKSAPCVKAIPKPYKWEGTTISSKTLA